MADFDWATVFDAARTFSEMAAAAPGCEDITPMYLLLPRDTPVAIIELAEELFPEVEVRTHYSVKNPVFTNEEPQSAFARLFDKNAISEAMREERNERMLEELRNGQPTYDTIQALRKLSMEEYGCLREQLLAAIKSSVDGNLVDINITTLLGDTS